MRLKGKNIIVRSLAQLAAAVSLLLVLIFAFGCWHFSVGDKYFGACHFIYDYQTLIAGLLALGAAFMALVPVSEQVKMGRLQSAITTREVLLKRLDSTEERRKRMAGLIGTITADFNRAIYPYDPEGAPVIDPEWAFQAESVVREVVEKLRGYQSSRSDPASINVERDNLILVADQLASCLYLIPLPARTPWDDPDLGLSREEQDAAAAKAEVDAKVAEAELPTKISTVRRVADSMDDSYVAVIDALRQRLRNIDDFILDREVDE